MRDRPLNLSSYSLVGHYDFLSKLYQYNQNINMVKKLTERKITYKANRNRSMTSPKCIHSSEFWSVEKCLSTCWRMVSTSSLIILSSSSSCSSWFNGDVMPFPWYLIWFISISSEQDIVPLVFPAGRNCLNVLMWSKCYLYLFSTHRRIHYILSVIQEGSYNLQKMFDFLFSRY